MSLSNILQSNNFDIYANSETLVPRAAQPVPGNNTLWINSANGHLYFGNVDLQDQGPPAPSTFTSFSSAAGWFYEDNVAVTTQVEYDNLDTLLSIDKPSGPPNTAFVVNFDPMVGCPPGMKLTSFSIAYNQINEISTIVVELTEVEYRQEAAPLKTGVPITGPSLDIIDYAIATFVLPTAAAPGANAKFNVSITLDLPNIGADQTIDFYGAFCDYSV